MSQFEFVMTVVSVFMSFGVVRLLDGLRSTLSAGRRYWVHSSWVVIRLASYVVLWWGSWAIRDFESWNLLMFSLWLVPFGLLYLQSTALVTTRPNDIQDWRIHFYGIRTWFFATNVFFIMSLFLTTSVLGGVPILHPMSISYLIILTISVAGYFSDSHKVQAAIVLIAWLNLILGWGVQLFDPAPLIPPDVINP
jgi:hypothetical protein